MVEEQFRVVSAATDGACSGNPGPGGWGALLRFEDGSIEELGGFEASTTNNRMELQAALAILKRLKDLPRHPDLKIRTDSKYLINGMNSWMVNWKRRGWVTAGGKPVLNKDLRQALDSARLVDVNLVHVKGHSGDPDNDRVDKIAVSFSKGTSPILQSGKTVRSQNSSHKNFKADEHLDLVPQSLQELLSRFEFADRLSKGGYSLNLSELSNLLEEPMDQLKKSLLVVR